MLRTEAIWLKKALMKFELTEEVAMLRLIEMTTGDVEFTVVLLLELGAELTAEV